MHLVDTGAGTLTGGRVKRLEPLIGNETFMLTYGDGVANVAVPEVLAFHRANERLATVTAVRPQSRFGGFSFDGDVAVGFDEKKQINEGWINGGFMVLEPGVFKYLKGDADVLETDLLERLAQEVSSPHIGIRGFGSAWIPRATGRHWKRFGIRPARHGSSGTLEHEWS